MFYGPMLEKIDTPPSKAKFGSYPANDSGTHKRLAPSGPPETPINTKQKGEGESAPRPFKFPSGKYRKSS